MKNVLRGWLKPNELTPDPADFSLSIDTLGSVGVKETVDALVAEGMEMKPETAHDIITRFNRKCIELAFRGYNVNTGIVYMRPMVKGVFRDKTWDSKLHRLYMAITQGPEIRKAIENTTVEIMGEHPDPIAIFSITDTSTGLSDGNLTRGLIAEIKGSYIRIAGDNNACGLYLKHAENGAETKIDMSFIGVNDPSKVLFVVPPTLVAGAYELRIVTQFGSGGKNLKQPRSVTLPYMVEVT